MLVVGYFLFLAWAETRVARAVWLPAMSHPMPTSHPVSCTTHAPLARWSPELWRHSSEDLIGETKTLNSNGKLLNPLIPREIESRPELFASAPGRIAI
jgi:hypothetical protein